MPNVLKTLLWATAVSGIIVAISIFTSDGSGGVNRLILFGFAIIVFIAILIGGLATDNPKINEAKGFREQLKAAGPTFAALFVMFLVCWYALTHFI